VKKLDLFILRTAIVPFIATLLIGNFVFLMQFLYRKLDELIGKGLSWDVLAELVMHASFTLIPFSLPLSVLIASVMAMGNLGEKYELVALKTSGISLFRVFLPLIFASLFMSGVAFFFSNNVMPYSQLKLSALFYDIAQKKPSLLLKEGVFLKDFDNMVMKIDKKYEDGRLEGVIIYDHRKVGQTRVIRSESGLLENSDTSRFMVVKLFDGNLYEDKEMNNEYTRFAFKSLDLIVDMSSFDMGQTNEELFKDNARLKRIGQLSRDMDSIEMDIAQRNIYLNEDLSSSFIFYKSKIDTVVVDPDKDTTVVAFNFTELPPNEKITAISIAKSRARNVRQELLSADSDMRYNDQKMLDHKLSWYGKFALAFSCIVLFFIGAPMGALVRKGGFGMPIVISTILYVIHHVISVFGRQLAKEGVLTPLVGMWLATFVLFPFAIYLTWMAVRDSRIFNSNSWKTGLNKILTIFTKQNRA